MPQPSSPQKKPYISLVATARHDDHGHNLLHRVRAFVRGWLEQCRRFSLDAELILVEWNPPADRARLKDILPWPVIDGPCVSRIIEVPPQLHERFAHSQNLPLFQMIAKNVGIRRARGEFVLVTNIDILFSDELMAFLAQRKLRDDCMYRVDRMDTEADIPLDIPIDAQLRWCGTHLLRANTIQGTKNLRTGDFYRNYWDQTWRVRLLDTLQDWNLVPIVTRKRLHTNGCGDFTLLSKQRWDLLRGYAEWAIFSMHLDSLLCHCAYWSGAREVTLPYAVYHIEHGAGSGWTPEGEMLLDRRTQKLGLPWISLPEFNRMCIGMRRGRKATIFNLENWGLAEENLPEVQI